MGTVNVGENCTSVQRASQLLRWKALKAWIWGLSILTTEHKLNPCNIVEVKDWQFMNCYNNRVNVMFLLLNKRLRFVWGFFFYWRGPITIEKQCVLDFSIKTKGHICFTVFYTFVRFCKVTLNGRRSLDL